MMRTLFLPACCRCRRHRQLPAGAQKGPGVLAPVLLIEIHRQQMTGVVLQQGVEAEGMVAGQMAVDRRIGEGRQLPVMAVAAADPGLLADAGSPGDAVGLQKPNQVGDLPAQAI